MSNKKEKKVINDKSKKSLGEGVTVEPQDQEHMHLKHIMHSPALVDVYLDVSDDDGSSFGYNEVEESVKSFINEFKDKELHEIDKPAVVISQLQSLHSIYYTTLERVGNITDGIQTKSGIRRGMLLNIEKRLLRKDGRQWIDHYAQTYGKKSLRSAQDYMALARTPNIIRYSVFGKERLMAGLRAIKALKIESDDPMATLLDLYNISFNPENSRNEETMMDLKLGIDFAVAITKIKSAEQKEEIELGVNFDHIKTLLGDGVAINNDFIKDLFIIKNDGRDVNCHLEGLIAGTGNGDELLPHIKKLNELPKIVAGLKGTVECIRQHDELVGRVEQGNINDLEQCISDLKNLVQVDMITDK
jgi:hypothetical protein